MKLISLNIEGNRHLERVVPFLKKEKPGVVFLQELFERDSKMLGESLGMKVLFAPMYLLEYKKSDPDSWESMGIGILSHEELQNGQARAYRAPSPELQRFNGDDVHTKQHTERAILLSGNVPTEEGPFTVATTHFTWTPNGMSNEYQETDSDALLGILSDMPEVILCGDFNMPRGVNDTYKKFTSRYTDVVPSSYVSSIDVDLHRSGANNIERERLERFMVDYIFLSKHYQAENVRLEKGVSDHMAVVGDITRAHRIV